MGEVLDGTLDIQNAPEPNGKPTIKLLGGKVGGTDSDPGGAVFIGGNKSDGIINFFPKEQDDPYDAVKLDNKNIDEISTVRILGSKGNIQLVGNLGPQMEYTDGVSHLTPTSLKLFRKFYDGVKANQATIYADGIKGDLWIGGNGGSGNLYLFPEKREDIDYPLLFVSDINSTPPTNYATLIFRAENASMRIGGYGRGGKISMYPEQGVIVRDKRVPYPTIEFFADWGPSARGNIGGYGKSGELYLYPRQGRVQGDKPSIFLDGESGDITLANADCAEEFDISEPEPDREIEPGAVMVIDDEGKLQMCSTPYDTRVAGVISGAGSCKPGIILGKRQDSRDNRLPLALVGKVNCKVDANYSKIRVGDMLTTSNTPGYAMKVTERSKAFGAVIGKALSAITSGKALIPILIALQ